MKDCFCCFEESEAKDDDDPDVELESRGVSGSTNSEGGMVAVTISKAHRLVVASMSKVLSISGVVNLSSMMGVWYAESSRGRYKYSDTVSK